MLEGNRIQQSPVFNTDSEAYLCAKKLDILRQIIELESGAVVFKKGNSYITRDVDGHNGGAWKKRLV